MRRPIAIASLALGLLLLLAAPAAAGHHKFRVGVMDGILDPPRDIKRMGTADAAVFRTMWSWKRIETRRAAGGRCSNARYSWGYTDQVVRQASRHGVDVLPFIVGSPDYVPGGSGNAPPTGSPAMVHYKCFVRAAVNRYGRGGTYPRDAGVRPIREWQVWNEPNLPQFAARGKVSPREYGKLLKVTRGQILRQDPRATIVLAGLPEFSSRGMDAKPFLQRFYRIRGIERKFDALSLHPYARNHRGVKGAMIRMQRLLKRVGDRRRSVWITEVGWGTHPRVKHFLIKSERGQATQLKKTFRMLRNKRERFNVGTVAWFRWRDTYPRSADRGPFEYAGLYLKNGKPKRSCRAFANFTGGRCRPIQGITKVSSAAGASHGGAEALIPSPEE